MFIKLSVLRRAQRRKEGVNPGLVKYVFPAHIFRKKYRFRTTPEQFKDFRTVAYSQLMILYLPPQQWIFLKQ